VHPLDAQTRVIVTGGRDADGIPDGLVAAALDAFDTVQMRVDHLIAGSVRRDKRKGTVSVDLQAIMWALSRERVFSCVPAKWKTGTRGKGAGPARNDLMPRLFVVHAVLAFPGGQGTAHMCLVALREGLPLWECAIVDAKSRAFEWRRVT
jgi:hypothetical protein